MTIPYNKEFLDENGMPYENDNMMQYGVYVLSKMVNGEKVRVGVLRGILPTDKDNGIVKEGSKAIYELRKKLWNKTIKIFNPSLRIANIGRVKVGKLIVIQNITNTSMPKDEFIKQYDNDAVEIDFTENLNVTTGAKLEIVDKKKQIYKTKTSSGIEIEFKRLGTNDKFIIKPNSTDKFATHRVAITNGMVYADPNFANSVLPSLAIDTSTISEDVDSIVKNISDALS